MAWRCLLTSSIRLKCANIRRLHNIFLFRHQALVWEGQDYLWKSASKVSKKFNLVPFVLLLGIDWRYFWGGLIFRGLLPVTSFLWKMPFWNTYFCSRSWSILLKTASFCKNFWNGLKNCIPKSFTVFQKIAMKMKNAIFKTAKWTRKLGH